MTAMSAEPGLAGVTTGRPFTVDDLGAMPNDGHRYELIDGVLVVTPAPGWSHQEGQADLLGRLRAACPRQFRVLGAPFAVQPDRHTEVQPDVLVARYDQLTARNLPTAPLLAVEFLSPSTRLYDRNTKRAAYERMGVASLWLIDPDTPARLTAFTLDEHGRYQQSADVVGDDEFSTGAPFPLTFAPARLFDGLAP